MIKKKNAICILVACKGLGEPGCPATGEKLNMLTREVSAPCETTCMPTLNGQITKTRLGPAPEPRF